jgi:hypothetical protein
MLPWKLFMFSNLKTSICEKPLISYVEDKDTY